jgi:hypothetical protein
VSFRWAAFAAAAVLLGAPAAAQTLQEPPLAPAAGAPRVRVGGLLLDSLRLLVVEHSVRVALQPKTRSGLEGPFWRDYPRSVRVPRSWEDADIWLVNYIGHPLHGAAAGRLPWHRGGRPVSAP